MPLLVCPSCEAGMKAISRNGIEIDICSSCRGVWLDRGELEKLLVQARAAANDADTGGSRFGFEQDRPTPMSEPAPRSGYSRRSDDDDDDDDRVRDDRYRGSDRHRRKSRLLDLLDIFD